MKGFSLIELLVAISIVTVISGGAMVAANKFGNNQKMAMARDQLVSTLRLARNYAKTVQVLDLASFKYLEVTVDTNGLVTATARTSGQELMRKDLTPPEVALSSSTIYFSPYLGKLLANSGGSYIPVSSDYEVKLFLINNTDTDDTLAVTINGSGLIDGK
jgi:prepilin-type N-terminal cleavage/methylation domain-containing protein